MSRTRLIVSAILIVLIGLIAAPASWAGGLKTVPTTVSLAAGFTPAAVVLADVNNDTIADLVVAECKFGAPNAGQVEIFQGDGLGGFTLKATKSLGTACPQALAVGQLSNGAPAVPEIVVGADDGTVTVYQDDTTATFVFTALGPYTLPNALTANVTGLAIADMNGDGNQDIIVADGGNNAVDVLLGNGLTAFVPTTSPSSITGIPVGSGPAGIVVADFDGDGKMDVATANKGSNNISVLINNTSPYPLPGPVPPADATFAAAVNTAVGTQPVAIAAGLLTAAGTKPDLVVANNGSTSVSVLLNSGTGTFPSATPVSVTGAPTGIALGNFSTHTIASFNDIIVSTPSGAELVMNDGTGTFTFAGATATFAAGTTPAAVAVNNINADAWVDAAVANGGSSNVTIFLGTPFYAITPVAVSAVEGVAFTNTSVLTFKYDNTPAVGNFSGNIDDWGDTGTSAGTVTGPVAGVYTVEGGYTYADAPACTAPCAEGTKNISVTATNTTDTQSISITPTSVPPSAQATVVDGTLTPVTPADLPDAAPPHTYTTVTVAQFDDQNLTAPITDFTVTIDWDDCGAGGTPHGGAPGTCAPGNLVAGTVTQPGGIGTTFTVTGTNTFNTVGNFAIATTITDTEATQSPAPPITVTIHANLTTITPTAVNPITPHPIEGKALANGVVLANFTSSNASGVFTAQVTNWGDGASEAATVTGTTPNFQVVTSGSTHKYADENLGGLPVSITINDTNDGSTATVTSTAIVDDGLIAVTVSNAVTAVEGSVSVGNIGSFTDENTLTTTAAYTVTIDWGDCGPGGTPLACAFVPATGVSGNNGSFTVADTHTYAEEGSFTARIKVVDIDSGQTVTGTGTVTVTDALLSNLVVNAVSGGGSGPAGELVANVDTWNGTVATFQDANTGAPTTDFTVNIAWGDTTTTNCVAPCAAVQTNGPAGNFKVVTSHMFTKAGTQLTPVTVTVTDIGGAPALGPTAGTAAVVTSLNGGTPQALTPAEGVAFTNSNTAGFTSQRAGAVAADFNVVGTSITWGDGGVDNAPGANITIGGAFPNFQVQGSHTYAEETPNPAICGNAAACPITVTVKDNIDGSTLTITGSTATVGDAPLAATAVTQLGPVNEGTTLSNVTVLQFTDANINAPTTDFTSAPGSISINWGDGNTDTTPSPNVTIASSGCVTTATGPFTPSACVAGAFHLFTVSGTHTYAEGGLDPQGTCTPASPNATCQIKVTVVDEGGSNITNFNSTSALVADAPLSALAVLAVSGGGTGQGGELVSNKDTWNGTLATFTDGNTTAPTGDFQVDVNWGDGSPLDTCVTPCAKVQTNGPAGDFKVVTSHMFLKAGTQLSAIQVTITDKGGAAPLGPTAGTAAVVTSLDFPPTNKALTPKEGVAFTNQPTLDVLSHRVGAANTDFAIAATTVNWGDGTTDTGAGANVAIAALGGGSFQVQGSHTYVEETPNPALCGNAAACPITVTVKDNIDGSTLTGITGSTATVGDAPLAATAVTQLGPVNEGTALSNVTVLQFTDANINAPTTDFTTAPGSITIDWGDGTSDTTPSANVTIASSGCVTTATGPFTGTACAPGAFHLFTVSGTHTYTEGGLDPLGTCTPASPNATCQIKVTVVDEGGSNITNFNSTSALVADAPLSNLQVAGGGVVAQIAGGGSGVGGELVANVDNWTGTVATFTDGNTLANPATDFSVVIAWGDTTTTNCPAPCALVSGAGGNFSIITSHIFTNAGTLLTPVTVTVTDKGGAPPLGPTPGNKAIVTSLYQPTPIPITETEGVTFANDVGSFHQTTNHVAGNLTVGITWGDGNASAGGLTPVATPPGNVFSVSGTNKYAEETPHAGFCGGAATCPITISVTDTLDGSTLTVNSTAAVSDAPLTPSAVAGLGPVNEGTALSNVTVLKFLDDNTVSPACPGVGCDFTATIDWGDGTTSAGTVTGPLGGPFTVTGSHLYTEGGLDPLGACVAGSPYAACPVKVTVVDEGGSTINAFNGTSAQVGDAPLSNPVGVAKIVGTLAVTNLVLGTFNDGNPGAPQTDFTATIDWGDCGAGGTPGACGFVSAGSVTGPTGGPFTVSGSHTFVPLATLFHVSIQVQDKGGAAPIVINSTVTTPATAGASFGGAASPPASLVQPGQSIDVLITLSPSTPAFTGVVTFTGCTIVSTVPAGLTGPITCSFNPNTVPDVAQIRTVHMIVQTFSATAKLSAPPVPGRSNPVQLALLLPGFAGVFGMVLLGGSKKSRRRTILWFGASLLLLTLLLVGCGGGGPTITPSPSGNGTQAGTYTLQVDMTGPPNPPNIQVSVQVQ